MDRFTGFSPFFRLLLKRVYMKLSAGGDNSFEKMKAIFSIPSVLVKIGKLPDIRFKGLLTHLICYKIRMRIK